VLTRRAGGTAGFTMVEMLTVMAIFAVLVALGVPIMRTWIANVQVRSVADAIQNGVRMAQAESLRRSRLVVFLLTNSTTPQTTFSPVSNGKYWAVYYIPAMTDGTDTNTFIQSGETSNSSPSVSVTGSQSENCFNSAGRLVGYTNTVNGITYTCAVPTTGSPPMWTYLVQGTGSDRQLQVEVALGGQVHMCDPSQTLSSSDPYGC